MTISTHAIVLFAALAATSAIASPDPDKDRQDAHGAQSQQGDDAAAHGKSVV